jgi:hypothetical protein
MSRRPPRVGVSGSKAEARFLVGLGSSGEAGEFHEA